MAITLIGACTGWSYNGTTVYLSTSGSLNVLAGDIVVAAIQINPSSINVSSIQKNSGTATVGAFTVRTKIINGTKVGLTVGYAIVTGSGTLSLSATASSTPTTSIAGCVTYRGASGVVGGTGGTGTGTDVTLSITTTVAESWVVFAGSINTALGLASGTNCVVEATRIMDPGGTASDLTVSLGSNETPLSIQTIAAHMVGGASVVWAADILELLSASQLIVPDSDISRDSGWDTYPIDQDLYPQLANYSDANYVIGYVPDSSTITFEVSLSNPAGTPSGSTATVKFRAKYVGGYGLSLNIKLKEGGWDNNSLTPTLTTSYVEYSFNCTGLTNYNDLTIFVTAETSSASQVYISGIKVEVPNAGGAVLKKIIGETLQISEAIVRRKAMKRLIGETEQITEAIARRKAMNRLIGETEQITEAIVRRKAMSRLINETIQFIESKIYVLGVAGAALLKIINETLQISEAILRRKAMKRLVGETVQIVEGILKLKTILRFIVETIQITESILRRTALVRLINETNQIAETILRRKAMSRLINEVVQIAEAVSKLKTILRFIGETVQIAETILRRKAMNRLIAETIQIAESILRRKAMSRLINETIQFIESKIYVLGVVGAALLKIINETVQIAEASLRRKSMTRIINEAVSVVESVLRRVALVRIINETEYIIEALLRRSSLKRILNEGIAIGEGVIRLKTMIRILNEAIEIAETILTRHGLVRWINETIEITEEILKFRGFVIIINETIQIIENTTSILNYITILARKIFYAVERLREFISRHPRVFQSDERQSDLDARSRRDQFQSTKREEFKKKL